ncbi:hypothetical protein RND81_04G174600 [Saponaria officinalis]|uniref:GBF-interacting protein 1 N-terminal domain-containing protein n=1 Tax=Saponaria officinalis TaxID=3572 RepID=A0AAW1LEW7_SAPOF
MSNNGVSSTSRVSIPTNVRKTIHNIKEIAKNHSDDDIYAMLKECSMDPNETAQRLLHLDTFHQVKRKRGRKNEVVKSRPGEDSRWKPGNHARGTRGGRGNTSSQRHSDAGGRRSNSSWKENGVVEIRDRGFRNPPAPVSKEINAHQPRHVEKAMAISTIGPVKIPNGNLGGEHDSKPSGTESCRSKESTDHVLMPSEDSLIPPSGGAVQRDERIEQISTAVSPRVPVDDGLDSTKSSSDSHQCDPQGLDRTPASTSIVEKEAYKPANIEQTDLIEFSSAEKSHAPDIVSAVKPISLQDVGPLAGVEEAASKLVKLKISDAQNVIIPDHIQVPDAVKNVLNFGSINASFGVRANYVQNGFIKNSHSTRDEAPDEASEKSSSRDEDTVSPAMQGEHTEFQHLEPHSPDENHPGINHPVDSQVLSSANNDQLKEHNFPAMGPPFPIVQATPNYSFGFMPPMLANTLVHPEGFESQAHVSSSLSGSSPGVSTSSTPPLTQSNGVGQASVAVSPHQIPPFRQPYPPNFFPYSHYYSQFYIPPNMHQYYSHSAFPTPLPTSNVFMPPPTAAAAMKTSPAHYKPRANGLNQAPNGVASSYGMYGQNNMATSGNPNTSADLLPTAPKDNYTYSGQQNEGSAVWHPATGRDTSSFPINAFLGHQLINPQSGHGPFTVYHTLQPIPSPAPGHPLLQQSQPVIGPVESVGPPSNAYQQAQINWNM